MRKRIPKNAKDDVAIKGKKETRVREENQTREDT